MNITDRVAEIKMVVRNKIAHPTFHYEGPNYISERQEFQAQILALLDSAAKLAPKDPEILLLRAEALWRYDGDRTRACHARLSFRRDAFELALRENFYFAYEMVTEYCPLDTFCRDVGQEWIKNFLAKEPSGHACLHYLKAVLLYEDRFGSYGNRYDAILELDRALAIEEHVMSSSLQGRICLDVGDWGTAFRAYTAALRYSPNDPTFLRGRARAREAMYDPEGAARDFAASVKIAPPDNAGEWTRVAETYLKYGWTKEAVAALDAAMACCRPHSVAWIAFKRALAKRRAGDSKGALQDLELAATSPEYRDRAMRLKNEISDPD